MMQSRRAFRWATCVALSASAAGCASPRSGRELTRDQASATTTGTARAIDTLDVRIDGRRIHMVSAGAGSPAIVFEAGFTSTHRTWIPLMRQLADSQRVIAYDRAGLGASDPGPKPRTSRQIADELRQALRIAGVDPPFLLVGHSAGGLHIRVFAGAYPADVAGLVLVDPAPADFYERAKREQPTLYAFFDSVDAAGSDTTVEPGSEDAMWDAALEEARAADSKYTGPAVVLSSPRADLRELGPIWADENRRWAAAAPRRRFVLVDGVGHNVQRERPSAVLDAIRQVLRQ